MNSSLPNLCRKPFACIACRDPTAWGRHYRARRANEFGGDANFPCPYGKGEVSAGLGDTVAKITRRLGVEPCAGCEERRAKLNAVLPYNSADLPPTGE